MRSKKKNIWIILILILCVCLAAGILLFPYFKGNKEDEVDTGWKIYCVNNAETQVVSFSWQMEAEEPEDQIRELLSAMSGEQEGFKNKKALPDTVTMRDWTLKGGQLTLNFDASYSDMTGISEILRRTAIVKTLCQVEAVEYVAFTVGGQPLMDTNAQPIGLMSSSDFIDNTGGETNYTQRVTLTLYYTGKDGKTLKQSRHQIEFDGTISLETLVIEQLLAGPLPEETDLYPTLPPNAHLLKASKKDEICYVDFDSAFLDKLADISDEVAIYSVVNSLAELSGITRVQFTIGGEPQKTYRENLAFDGLFERNLEIVEDAN